MDHLDYTLSEAIRQKGKHLTLEDRGIIKVLHKHGYSDRYIARELNCSPSTVADELRRGTAVRSSHRGRPVEYIPKRGQRTYNANRLSCGRKPLLNSNNPFVKWVATKVKNDKWSLDTCAGYAKAHNLFEGNRVCTKTLYNSLHA